MIFLWWEWFFSDVDTIVYLLVTKPVHPFQPPQNSLISSVHPLYLFIFYLFCSFNPVTCKNLCNINKAKYVQEKHGKRQSKYLHIKYNPCHILEIKNIHDYMVVHSLVRVEYRRYLVPGTCRWEYVTETHQMSEKWNNIDPVTYPASW